MIALGILQFITFRSFGQMTMPDHVCTGQTRHYYVIPGPVAGSTYIWWIDGSVMSGYNASEFIYTWNSSKTYLLEVQERSANGCPGPKKSGQVFVNPQPEIQISVSDSLICSGESVTVSVQNPSGLIWGKWIYDLIVEPEAGIIGNTINGTYTSPTELNETLYNNDKEVHKVVYRFIPRIVTDDGVKACEGKEVKITVWIYPGFRCKEAFLEIHDAFSPNGDGINDVWNIKAIHLYPDATITVYNRWGQILWRSERGYTVPWDGRSRRKALPIDSYHYFIDLHDRSKPLVGTVTIVR
jgi:gliding motility-associated-like protein